MSGEENNNKSVFIIIAIVLLIAIFAALMIPRLSYVVNNKLDVMIGDQTTRPIDINFARSISGPYLLNSDPVVDAYEIELTSSIGLSVNDNIGLFQDSTNPAFFFAQILAINGNILTVDTPLDEQFYTSISPVLFELDKSINEDGSTTRVIYSIDNDAEIPIDITRLILIMVTDTLPEFTDFGDITNGLTNGCVLRKKNNDGSYWNIYNFKQNKDFSAIAFDYETYDASNPAQGENGLAVRLTFAGQEKHGVAIRLSMNESLELVVQDDLTSLLDFNIIAEGHFTDE